MNRFFSVLCNFFFFLEGGGVFFASNMSYLGWIELVWVLELFFLFYRISEYPTVVSDISDWMSEWTNKGNITFLFKLWKGLDLQKIYIKICGVFFFSKWHKNRHNVKFMLRLFIPRNTKFQHNFLINILIVMTNIKKRIQSSLIIKQLLWNWVHIGLAFLLIYRHFYACWGNFFKYLEFVFT